MKLIKLIAGWHSLSDFKKAVRDRRSVAADKRKKREDQEAAEARLEQAREAGKPFIAMGKPVRIAEDFIAQCRQDIKSVGEEWLDYSHNQYITIETREVRAAIQDFIESGVDAETGEPCNSDKYSIDKVIDALANKAFRSQRETMPPAWLNYWDIVDPDPKMVIAAGNGLLDLKTRCLMPLTPRFFTRNGLPYDYNPYAPVPKLWLKFMEDLWPDAEGGAENKDALQEIMGHLLTGETKYQKIFLFVGSGRGGKGTITNIITALCGKANVHSQPADQLGEGFGLQSLIGKQVLIIPDLRFGRGANYGGIIEKFLSISGEDDQSVTRKYMKDWSGRLNTRIVIASNKELVLPDQSGAFKMRLIPLVFHKSFEGKEDFQLGEKLLGELPGILNWALEGLDRLEARQDPVTGRPLGFQLTKDGRKMIETIHREGSPVQSFLNECCDEAKSGSILKEKLFEAFEGYCIENNIEDRHTPSIFARELRTASGQRIDKARLRTKNKRVQVFTHVDLKPEYVDYDWEAPSDF